MQIRKYDFDDVGVETGTQPDASDPVADEDVVTKGYADINYGGASGAGELNAISNPNARLDTTGWAVSGTCTVARLSSSAVLDPVITTALRMSSGSANDYVRYRFTMPTGLLNTKLKISFYQDGSASANGDWKVEIYKNSASNYSGSYTEFALSTDSSGNSLLSNAKGKYTTTFDADAGLYYELRFVRVSGSSALDITNVVVGPGIQPQGAVVGEWASFTPTGSFVTNATYTGFWRRVGSNMEICVQILFSGATSTTTGTFNIPFSLTIDTSKIPTEFPNANVSGLGIGNLKDDNAGLQYPIVIRYNTSTSVSLRFQDDDGSTGVIHVNLTEAAPITIANGDSIIARFTVPIAEWAGSGTVNLAQNDVEYSYNSSVTDADDTTSFAYGPQGGQFGNFTATRTKRVRFQTPIQPSDTILLQATNDSGTTWMNHGTTTVIGVLMVQNSVFYGASLSTINSTDVEVTFGQYRFANATTFGGAGDTYAAIDNDNQYRYRVVKIKAGSAVGFGTVSQYSAGLMPASHANLDNASATRLGLKSYISGTTYNGGVGPTTTTNEGGSDLKRAIYIPYQLQDGTWHLRGNIGMSHNSSTAHTITIVGVTFKNTTNFTQACALTGSGTAGNRARCNENASTIGVEFASGSTASYISFDVELESKPTWAY